MTVSKVYWDSCTYLDYLKGNHPLHDQMAALMQDWTEGNIALVTSALTIAEVLWVKCDPDEARVLIDQSQESDLRSLFDPPPPAQLTIVELSRTTALTARELVWKHNIKPKDAVHVASALEANCPLLQTNDSGLQKFNEKIGGSPRLKIAAPSWQRQTHLDELKPAAGERPS